LQSPDVTIQAPARGINPYAALFDQYKALVYRTAYLMLTGDAEDTLQDVFIRSLHTYDADPRSARLYGSR
jgi:DNA-directed RNA polymerase specialized sigma24 family protein